VSKVAIVALVLPQVIVLLLDQSADYREQSMLWPGPNIQLH